MNKRGDSSTVLVIVIIAAAIVLFGPLKFVLNDFTQCQDTGGSYKLMSNTNTMFGVIFGCIHSDSNQPTPTGDNLVDNPGFEDGSTGWDLRPTTELFTFDSNIKHSGTYSMKSVPGGDGSGGFNCVLADGNNNDRSYWQNYLPKVTPGDSIKLSGWVRHNGCAGAPNAPCWVDDYRIGSTVGCCSDRDGSGPVTEQCGVGSPADLNGGLIRNGGGARLGIDFRNEAGQIISDCFIIYDWTMPANTWYKLEQTWTVPPNSDNVIVWMQGHECNAPGTVWLDDVSLVIV